MNIGNWIKKNMPDTYQFFKSFFLALNNRNEGHSLKKWLAVGFFWLCAVCVYKYTETSNVEGVLIILTSMITALVITNTVQVSKTYTPKKDETKSDEKPKENEQA